jgi:dihydroflavonol-4-reductase
MKALVVGASGHVGVHLCRALLAAGLPVRALLRPASSTAGLVGLNVEIVRGDVLAPESLRAAMAGCTVAYHLAAPTSEGKGIDRIIRQGTRNVLREALRVGLERLVYTSSVVTIGYARDPRTVLDETSNELTPASSYHVAKWYAEREALDFTRCSGLPVVVVNPATVIGPLDFRVTPSNAPLQHCLDRGLFFAFHSGVTLVHVEDVARGHLLAMQRGRPGERYILGGDSLTIPEYFRLICASCERSGPRLIVPRWAMLTLGAGFSLARRLGKKTVPFTLRQARNLVGRYGSYSSQKAVSELGYSWRPVREAVLDYITWASARAG